LSSKSDSLNGNAAETELSRFGSGKIDAYVLSIDAEDGSDGTSNDKTVRVSSAPSTNEKVVHVGQSEAGKKRALAMRPTRVRLEEDGEWREAFDMTTGKYYSFKPNLAGSMIWNIPGTNLRKMRDMQSHKDYYFDTNTKHTSWKRPADVSAIPRATKADVAGYSSQGSSSQPRATRVSQLWGYVSTVGKRTSKVTTAKRGQAKTHAMEAVEESEEEETAGGAESKRRSVFESGGTEKMPSSSGKAVTVHSAGSRKNSPLPPTKKMVISITMDTGEGTGASRPAAASAALSGDDNTSFLEGQIAKMEATQGLAEENEKQEKAAEPELSPEELEKREKKKKADAEAEEKRQVELEKKKKEEQKTKELEAAQAYLAEQRRKAAMKKAKKRRKRKNDSSSDDSNSSDSDLNLEDDDIEELLAPQPYCAVCGSKNERGAKFCERCGESM
jgi:hypothetical protein